MKYIKPEHMYAMALMENFSLDGQKELIKKCYKKLDKEIQKDILKIYKETLIKNSIIKLKGIFNEDESTTKII